MTRDRLQGLLTKESVLVACEDKINCYIARKGFPPNGSREWDQDIKSPSRHTVSKYCGMTIEKLLEHFGYEAKYKSYHPKWTEEGILEQALRSIKEHIDKFDFIPGSREWEKYHLSPTKSTIKSVMNLSINQLIEKIGYEPKNSAGNHYSNQELIAYLQLCAKEKGDMPRISDFLADRPTGYPSIMAYYYRFGSFVDALTEAGFAYSRGFSKEYLYQRMQDFIGEFQRAPYPHELDGRKRPAGYPKGSTYVRAFGSVEECLMQLNRFYAEPEVTKWTEDSIRVAVTKEIVAYKEKHDRIIQSGEWDLLKLHPCRGVIRSIMGGGFNEFLIELGFTPACPSPVRYTNEDLLNFLKQYYSETGEQPAADIFRDHDDKYPDPINYQRRFGLWDNAMIEAGMKLNSSMRGKRGIAEDGHHCDSIRERQVDEFLYKHGIPHERDVLYPLHDRYNPYKLKRCDYFLHDREGNPVFLEYAGMGTEEYLQALDAKKKIAEFEGIRLIIITSRDLKSLSVILIEWIDNT